MISVEPSAIARIAYEARRVYARSLGDYDLPEWDAAPPQLREEAMIGVEAVLRGVASTGARLHEVWARRTPPLELPGQAFKIDYHDLPDEERRKVLLFRATVLALIDGPCTGICHDERCQLVDDHACHLDTCLSRFGVPPGAWQKPAPTPPLKLYS
jgi:hypothetical protein